MAIPGAQVESENETTKKYQSAKGRGSSLMMEESGENQIQTATLVKKEFYREGSGHDSQPSPLHPKIDGGKQKMRINLKMDS